MRIDVKVLNRNPYNKQGNVVVIQVPTSPRFYFNDDVRVVEVNRLYISVDTYNMYRQTKEEIAALKLMEDESHTLFSQVSYLQTKVESGVLHHEITKTAKDNVENIKRFIEFKENYIKQVEAGRYNV